MDHKAGGDTWNATFKPGARGCIMQTASSRGTGLYWFEQARAKRAEVTEMDTTISWKELGFRYVDTGVFVRADFRHGAWSAPELCWGASLSIHIAATCFHYGQACFEGLKAFRQKSGRVACFRADAHARRMIMSANRLVMVPPPQELFLEAVRLIVSRNDAYVPPFRTGATLYVRPLPLGTTPRTRVHPTAHYSSIFSPLPARPPSN